MVRMGGGDVAVALNDMVGHIRQEGNGGSFGVLKGAGHIRQEGNGGSFGVLKGAGHIRQEGNGGSFGVLKGAVGRTAKRQGLPTWVMTSEVQGRTLYFPTML